MLSYEECKRIAFEKAKTHNIELKNAYKIADDYVFDNEEKEIVGIIPFAVESESGNCRGLWNYLNAKDKSMDDIIEINIESGDAL